ncbi:MAG: sugar transferase [Desulfuromonadales bacterium]|nr:sugar transferase [Desulfuromonadales bacterium]
MLKEQASLVKKISIAIDCLMVGAALCLAYTVRTRFPGALQPLNAYLWVLIPVFPIWYSLFSKQRLYDSIRKLTFMELGVRLGHVHLLGGLGVASIIFFVDRYDYSRGLFLLFLLFSFLLLFLEKVCLRALLGFIRRRGYNVRYLLIVGTLDKAQRLNDLVEEHKDWGLKVVGFVQASPGPLKDSFADHEVLGRLEDLVAICKQVPVDEVVFCLPPDMVVDAEVYLKGLEELGVTVRMVLSFYELSLYRQELSFFHDELPILTFHVKELDAQQLFLKRILDIVGALVGLFTIIMLFPFIALAIKLNSPGPVFFGQTRLGESGRSFKCWKFRSMAVDAEQHKSELADKNEMNGAIFKMKDDPRVTAVGRFLRKTSLDELPQFWNVLKGEMSLVGTRPPTPDEVSQYENWHHRRISIRPGITGLWQVSGRSQVEDFDDVVKLDLQYIDNWTLGLDIRILLKTIWVVMTRNGSC